MCYRVGVGNHSTGDRQEARVPRGAHTEAYP